MVIGLAVFIIQACQPQMDDESSTIRFSVKIKTADPANLELFYTFHDSVPFNEKNKLVQSFNPSEDFQQVDFEFEGTDLPAKLRLDLATSNQTKQMAVKDLEFAFKGKTIQFDNDDWHLNFEPNEYVTESSPGHYSLHEINNRFDPYLTTTPFFAQRLKIEY